jgi:hypothetical protein
MKSERPALDGIHCDVDCLVVSTTDAVLTRKGFEDVSGGHGLEDGH